jgi:hypothetical protein
LDKMYLATYARILNALDLLEDGEKGLRKKPT